MRNFAGLRDYDWQDEVWRHPHLFNNEAVNVNGAVINRNETSGKEVQDTSCWGSGGVPQH